MKNKTVTIIGKRIVSLWILAFLLCSIILPVSAFADDEIAVERVEITITNELICGEDPLAEANYPNVSISTDSHAYVYHNGEYEEADWLDEETGLFHEEAFIGGNRYSVYMMVVPEDGYKFDDNTAFYINDKEAYIYTVKEDHAYIDGGSFIAIHKPPVKVAAKPATCTKDGIKEHYECPGCGQAFSDSAGKNPISKSDYVTKALGHKWDKGVITKKPTYTETGIMTYTCLNDPSHTKTEVIPKLTKKSENTKGDDKNKHSKAVKTGDEGISLIVLAVLMMITAFTDVMILIRKLK